MRGNGRIRSAIIGALIVFISMSYFQEQDCEHPGWVHQDDAPEVLR